MLHTLRVIVATAGVNFRMQWRVFNWTGFALRFFTPIMIMSAAWVLYNTTFHGGSNESLQRMGISNYLSFIVTGNALFALVFASTFVVGRAMFWERISGTIEATFMSPMNRLAYMAGIMVAATINSLLDVLVVFAIGALFGFRIPGFNGVLFFSTLALFVLAMFGVGLMINGITLTFRDRTTSANTITLLFLAFSGVVAPINLMPQWAQFVSSFSPLTYAIALTRASMGVGTVSGRADLLSLSFLGIAYVVIGAAMLSAIEKNLRKKALFSVF